MEKNIYSVSELTHTIKNLLETSLPTLWLEGEVSNYKRHYSQHLYFSLKDESAQLSAVMWRSRAQKLPFQLEDGMRIRVLGNVKVYPPAGRYQFDVLEAEPVGTGSLQIAFEQLKRKLYALGWFDEAHKKALPDFPRRIVLITSPTGAAIRDMLNVLKRRAPYVDVVILPVAVQGERAPGEIARAINLCNRHKLGDVIIVGRGGGSLEDLWAFNEEKVAEAIFHSHIPVVSAVGHEIDYTIADLVADMRAPTPSAAAELAVVDKDALIGKLGDYETRLRQAVDNGLAVRRRQIEHLEKSHALRRWDDQLFQHHQYLDGIQSRLENAISVKMQETRTRLEKLELSLRATHPKTLMARGYSLTLKNGKIISSVSNLSEGDIITTELSDGSVESTVTRYSEKRIM
ncbi:MAG TPA: exodeoxyribonuclease VII large subunit [Caldithrix abyssi]|uniref:Exodeoxyribonuclease 7 large subunit n=1 Tax=Caldithrix abyssi TaxID=187145 RepID=A0A7V5RQN1_CALAY|nr:exodeoxyribonuclease VII large subunit [Caldithrix abyssi]